MGGAFRTITIMLVHVLFKCPEPPTIAVGPQITCFDIIETRNKLSSHHHAQIFLILSVLGVNSFVGRWCICQTTSLLYRLWRSPVSL